jgi:ABC-type transport system involved in cytochrome c biogenesis permease subunit
MISFTDYYNARELLQFLSPYFKACNVFFAFLIGYGLIKHSKKTLLGAYLLALLIYSLTFGTLIYFHQKIYNSVYLLAPFLPSPLRLFPPLWIETEKLFFWTFICLLLLGLEITFRKRLDHVIRYQLAILILFFLLNSLVDPFSSPLPNLHEEIVNLENAVRSGFTPASIAYIMNFYYRVKYFYHSQFMWTHPPLLFLAYGFFTLAFPLNLYSIFHKFEKDHSLELTSYRLIAAGYLVLTLGMLIGYPWAIQAWKGESWWWSPKINVSIMMWLFYTAYLHGRLYPASRISRSNNFLAVLSFSALVFTYLSTYILPGAHSYG